MTVGALQKVDAPELSPLRRSVIKGAKWGTDVASKLESAKVRLAKEQETTK